MTYFPEVDSTLNNLRQEVHYFNPSLIWLCYYTDSVDASNRFRRRFRVHDMPISRFIFACSYMAGFGHAITNAISQPIRNTKARGGDMCWLNAFEPELCKSIFGKRAWEALIVEWGCQSSFMWFS
jgi:hypothetical protein